MAVFSDDLKQVTTMVISFNPPRDGCLLRRFETGYNDGDKFQSTARWLSSQTFMHYSVGHALECFNPPRDGCLRRPSQIAIARGITVSIHRAMAVFSDKILNILKNLADSFQSTARWLSSQTVKTQIASDYLMFQSTARWLSSQTYFSFRNISI